MCHSLWRGFMPLWDPLLLLHHSQRRHTRHQHHHQQPSRRSRPQARVSVRRSGCATALQATLPCFLPTPTSRCMGLAWLSHNLDRVRVNVRWQGCARHGTCTEWAFDRVMRCSGLSHRLAVAAPTLHHRCRHHPHHHRHGRCRRRPTVRPTAATHILLKRVRVVYTPPPCRSRRSRTTAPWHHPHVPRLPPRSITVTL